MGLLNIIITSWALDSYLNLTHQNQFAPADYKETIRPDVLLLKSFATTPSPKFSNSKFWSPADLYGVPIRGAFKMKWHNLGPNSIQLRLQVGFIKDAFLLAAYVKKGPKMEARQAAKLKTRLELIKSGQYIECGRL